MAKAIHWPLQFRNDVLAEDCEQERIALRLGDLYYENRYWVPDEVVDIRVDHKKIRQGIVVGDLRRCRIQDLAAADFQRLKPSLQTPEAVIRFLNETYQQPVTAETLVTVVTYRNRPIIPEEMETS